MGITILGILVLPLSLIWLTNPVRLIQLSLVSSVFEAGAALIIGGSFGLPVGMVPGLLFVAYVCLQYALGMRYTGETLVFWAMAPLFALLGYAVLSIMILPQLFAGTIMVWPQRPDPLFISAVPLAFSSGNVTQPLYLAINIGIATAAALLATRARLPYEKILRAYLLGGYVVIALSFWDFLSRDAGLWFPSDILYSNPSWSIVNEMFGGVPRIQGPFPEPSALAFYLSGLSFSSLWLTLHGQRYMRVQLLFGLSLLTVCLSTSTTGIATVLVGVPLILVIAAARADRDSMSRLGKTAATLALGALIVIGPILVLKPELTSSIAGVVEATLSKGETSSYDDRTGMDAEALATAGQTYGLGVGWGSFRPSSLVPGIVANGGIFGLAMVLWVVLRVVRLVSRARVSAHDHPGKIVVSGFSAALCGQLAAALIADPMIVTVAFFLQLGCVIGISARLINGPYPRNAAALARAYG